LAGSRQVIANNKQAAQAYFYIYTSLFTVSGSKLYKKGTKRKKNVLWPALYIVGHKTYQIILG